MYKLHVHWSSEHSRQNGFQYSLASVCVRQRNCDLDKQKIKRISTRVLKDPGIHNCSGLVGACVVFQIVVLQGK